MKASDRSYSHRISLLKQELTVIRGVLAEQASVYSAIAAWRRVANQQAATRRRGDPRDPRVVEEARARGIEIMERGAYNGRRQPAYYASGAAPRARWDEDDSFVADDPMTSLKEAFMLASTDPGGFRDLLSNECRQLLDRRTRDFNDYESHANTLEDMVCNDNLTGLPHLLPMSNTSAVTLADPEPQIRT